MSEKIKALLLLDDNSKAAIKTNISAMSSNGIHFITSLAEINDKLVESCNKLIILDGYLELSRSYMDLLLYKSLYDLQLYYLGNNDSWLHYMKPISTCYRCKISVLDQDVIQAALYQDNSLEATEDLNEFDDCTTLAQSVLNDNKSTSAVEAKLANSLLSIKQREDILLNENHELRERNEQLEDENLKMRKKEQILTDKYSQLIDSSITLNRTLKEYEVVLTRNIYTKLDVHNYGNRPDIIYIKEYEDLPELDSLLDTLFNVFRIQMQKSVKVLRLYDNSGNRKLAVLPDYYNVILNKYTSSDISSNDFLAKTGDYLNVLDSLLMNRINLDVLIIVDCKDHNDTVLTGSALQLCTCRDREHMEAFGLKGDNTIVYGDDGSQNDTEVNLAPNSAPMMWGDYDFDGTNNEQFVFYSSRPVIKKILLLFDYFKQSI